MTLRTLLNDLGRQMHFRRMPAAPVGFGGLVTHVGGPERSVEITGDDGLRITIRGLDAARLRALAPQIFTTVQLNLKGADCGH